MKNTHMLLTGFRLLLILQMLYKRDMSKSEIINFLSEDFNITVSKETIKLDINTLIKAGFKITRGNKGNSFRLCLDKDFILQNLSSEDFCILDVIKNSSFDFLDYKRIINLKTFYKKISEFLPDNSKYISHDFRFFNMVNPKILQAAEAATKNESLCSVIYDSPERGRIEFETILKKIVCRNNKLYIDCCSKDYKKHSTLRIDNVKSIKEIKNFQRKKLFPKSEKFLKFQISKKFYENLPLEKFEHVTNVFDKNVEITTFEQDDFFIVQRLLSIGKNCIALDNSKIKEKVVKNLKDTLELYT